MEVTVLVILLVVLFVATAASKNKSAPPVTLKSEGSQDNQFFEQQVNRLIKNLETNLQQSPGINNVDKDVIDVSKESSPLHQAADGLTLYPGTIPYFGHSYVYSARELNYANPQQKKFYSEFKIAFLRGISYDVGSYSNYYFILMFDLLNEYDTQHSDLTRLEKQMDQLVIHYPLTRRYAKVELLKRMESLHDEAGIERISYEKEFYRDAYDIYSQGLGDKFRKKLNLSIAQVRELNALIDTSNSFNTIEYVAVEMIRMFFSAKETISISLASKGKTLKDELDTLSDIELTNHYHYQQGDTYNFVKTNFYKTFNQLVYKSCENRLRDHFRVGRKTEFTWYISKKARDAFDYKLLPFLNESISEAMTHLTALDENSDIALNEYSRARWKSELEDIEASFKIEDKQQYIDKIYYLEKTNQKNPSIENIFFQASRFIAKYDKVTSLKFYLDYIFYDLKSSKIDNKQLAKTIQKSLFSTKQQVAEFEKIVNDLIRDRDLSKSISTIDTFYQPKRKKIELNKDEIERVDEQHATTMTQLNEYLGDDSEPKVVPNGTPHNDRSEIKLQIVESNVPELERNKTTYGLNDIQSELVNLFVKNSFILSNEELGLFSKSHDSFKNQLVQGINEKFFDQLDDVLIEETDENFVLNESYYQKINSLC